MFVLLGYSIIAVVAAAAIFYVVVAFLPAGLTLTPERDQRPVGLPEDRRMVLGDLDKVRLPVALRGYRFAETDQLIDRMAAEIAVRDEELERLRAGRSAQVVRTSSAASSVGEPHDDEDHDDV